MLPRISGTRHVLAIRSWFCLSVQFVFLNREIFGGDLLAHRRYLFFSLNSGGENAEHVLAFVAVVGGQYVYLHGFAPVLGADSHGQTWPSGTRLPQHWHQDT